MGINKIIGCLNTKVTLTLTVILEILAVFKLAVWWFGLNRLLNIGGIYMWCWYSGLFIKECCRLPLEVLKQADLHKKESLQRASTELATCTACIEGHRTGPRVLLHALCHYVLCSS